MPRKLKTSPTLSASPNGIITSAMWKEENNSLTREFKFADFKTALEFVNRVGVLAEAANHHPDIELGWGRVKIILTTHSEGKITDKDHNLAEQIDEIKMEDV